MKRKIKSIVAIAMAVAVCLSFTFAFSAQNVYAASVPAKVTGAAKSYSGNYYYKVTWNKARHATKYQVYRASSKNGKYKRIEVTTLKSCKVKVLPGKKYYYKVRAINASKKGPFSAKLLIKTPVKPAKAADLKTSSYLGHYQYRLTWRKAKHAAKYEIYRSASKGGKYTKLKTTTSLSYTAYIIPGKKYCYKVRAINGITKGDFSGIISVATPTEKKLSSEIPVYWNEEVKNSVKTFKNTSGSSEFIYFTDSHWNANTKHSPAIINYISADQNIPLVVFGGDIIAGTHEKTSDAIAEISDFTGRFSEDTHLMCTSGNHDYNTSSGDIAPLTDKKLYELIYKKEKSFAEVSNFGRCAYTDDTANKIRYVSMYYDGYLDNITPQMGSLSSKSYPSEYELDWLKETVQDSSIDKDWTVILFTHGYYNFVKKGDTPAPTETGKKLGRFLLELQGDENTAADIGCWMVGHTHRDMTSVISDDSGSIRIICTNCDSYVDGSPSRGSGYWGGCSMTKGHDTEQAIDLVKVDTDNRKIHLIRVGAGKDRNYAY